MAAALVGAEGICLVLTQTTSPIGSLPGLGGSAGTARLSFEVHRAWKVGTVVREKLFPGPCKVNLRPALSLFETGFVRGVNFGRALPLERIIGARQPLEGMRALEERFNKETMSRVLAGDRRAVRGFVELVTPVIQARVARVLLGANHGGSPERVREEVADLTQEVFASLFKDSGRVLKHWDPERGLSIKNYVGLVAHRAAVSTLRSKRRNPFTEEPTECGDLDVMDGGGASGEAAILSRDLLRKVFARTEESLSETGRELFRLIFVEQREVGEIVELMTMSEAAVYAWRSRLSKAVRVQYRLLMGAKRGPAKGQGRSEVRL